MKPVDVESERPVARTKSPPELPVVNTTSPPPPPLKLRFSESCVCICAVRLSLTLSVPVTPSAVYQPVLAPNVSDVSGVRVRIQDCPAVRFVFGVRALSASEFEEPLLMKFCDDPDTDKPRAFSASSWCVKPPCAE